MTLKNKNFVITGASKGIGKAIAFELARNGANVALIARNKKDLDKTEKELKKQFPDIRANVYPLDVSSYASVKKTSKTIQKDFGEIDGLINNAGVANPDNFENKKVDAFENTCAVKYFGAVYMTKEFLPFLKDGGFISYTSSVLGYMGLFGYTSYAGPNYALIGFAESLAQEVMNRNISISVLCPPDTQTPGYDEENKTKPYETKKISETAKLMTPEAVAQKFIKKLLKRKFIITVNFESAMLYRLSRLLPDFFRWYVKYLIRSIQKKKQ